VIGRLCWALATAALLTACIAFQLNASMLSPALVTMGNELHTDQAVIGDRWILRRVLRAIDLTHAAPA